MLIVIYYYTDWGVKIVIIMKSMSACNNYIEQLINCMHSILINAYNNIIMIMERYACMIMMFILVQFLHSARTRNKEVPPGI